MANPDAAEALFVDTNVLVYANWDAAPLHGHALSVITQYEAAQTPLVISRQILREYLATLMRPRVGLPIATLITQITRFEARCVVVEDEPAIFRTLLDFLALGASTHIFDTNIVATMQVAGVRRLLTNNPDHFQAFASHIEIIPLVP